MVQIWALVTYWHRQQDGERLIGQRIVDAIEEGGGWCQSPGCVIPILVPGSHFYDPRGLQLDDIQVVSLADVSLKVDGTRKQMFREAQL